MFRFGPGNQGSMAYHKEIPCPPKKQPRSFIVMFIGVCRWTVTWKRYIQFTFLNHVCLKPIITFLFHLHKSHNWSLPFRLSNLNCIGFSNLFHVCSMHCPSYPSHFGCCTNILRIIYGAYYISFCSLLLLPLPSSKYSSHHPVIKYSQ